MKTRESAEISLRKFSFSGQAKQISVPIATVRQGMMLGFQPFSVTSSPLNGGCDLLAISAYYESAVCLAKVNIDRKITSEGFINFEVEWVRGAKNTVRLFPDLDQVTGGNRCYVAYINFAGNLVVGRGERKLYVLERDVDGKWEYNDKFIQLPGHESGDYFYVVYANEIKPGIIETNEYDGKCERWQRRCYSLSNSSGLYTVLTAIRVPQFCHQCLHRETPLSVFDRRMPESQEQVTGLNFDVPGTGVAPLSNGGHVSVDFGQYDTSSPFNGVPGSLTYLSPAS